MPTRIAECLAGNRHNVLVAISNTVADPEGVLRVPGHQPSWHGAAGAREIEVDSARRV